MPLDQRLIGSWIDESGISVIKLDPDTGDGRWYVTGPAAQYSMPDAQTLLYPLSPRRIYKRIDYTGNETIIGHWRHDPDPATEDDIGEDIIFRPDGVYVDFWDGESIFYDGSYTSSQDAAGTYLSIVEYRLQLQTQGNAYSLKAVWDFAQDGTFSFGTDPSGKKTVTFSPSDGSQSWMLTELAAKAVNEPTTIGAVRRDAIRKRRAE